MKIIFYFLFFCSFTLFAEKKEEPIEIPLKEDIAKPKKNSPFYIGGNWGLSYQVTDLDVTLDNGNLLLGVHPFTLEFFLGYHLWWFRFETSFLFRPMKKYQMRYESEDKTRKFLIMDYEAVVSTYGFNFKLLFDLMSIKTYFNPYLGAGVALTGTHLKTWSETEKREKNDAVRIVPGKVTSSLALLGIVGNSFPISNKVNLQFQYQFTFLQGIETKEKATTRNLYGDELNKRKALPLKGYIFSSDFLFGARYSL
jgi:opacity protein-like surface antigen